MLESMLFLSDAEVQKTMTMAEALELAEKGIRADAAGQVAGDKFYMGLGEDGFIKPFSGYLAGEELAFVKTFSYFPGNRARLGLSATSSVLLLFDAQSGLPVCMMEADWVTALKTGASTAVTAAWLARPDAHAVTIFGAGSLGRMHLRALAHRFSLDRAYIIDIIPQMADAYAAELSPEMGFPIEPVLLVERERAVRASDIVVTVTTGDQPLVERAWLRPGAFVARLGSYQEIALDVITSADRVIVDNWHYVQSRIPELKTLAEQGRFTFEDIHAEWPDIVFGKKPGRESDDQVIVYIALGIWGEYAAILPEVYRRALARGLGKRLSTPTSVP
ncbi:MAG: ornithine cyclodeaminase family protein [Anaerolineae bacterium]|jgi:ornithine cyclodeaminase/alanine dehydrogenase-like protein (mu-crystallin family)